jgi:TolA-binding protein
MKAQERHQLKQNEIAITAGRFLTAVAAHRDRIILGAVVLVAVGAAAGGYGYWKGRTEDQASALLAQAMAVSQAPIVPAPTVPGATQQAGTYPTEQAKLEAARKGFEQVVGSYPSTASGEAARYHLGSVLLMMGRHAEAEAAFRDLGGRSASLYGQAARLGLAQALAAQAKYADAIKTLTDLSAERDGAMPVDGVLMELARVSEKAGKREEARAAFRRVVDEFPESPYVPEARARLSAMG